MPINPLRVKAVPEQVQALKVRPLVLQVEMRSRVSLEGWVRVTLAVQAEEQAAQQVVQEVAEEDQAALPVPVISAVWEAAWAVKRLQEHPVESVEDPQQERRVCRIIFTAIQRVRV